MYVVGIRILYERTYFSNLQTLRYYVQNTYTILSQPFGKTKQKYLTLKNANRSFYKVKKVEVCVPLQKC